MTLKVGIVTGSLSPSAGGLFTSVRIPANKLRQAGADVCIYGLQDEQFERYSSQWQNLKTTAYPIIGPGRFGYSPQMKKALSCNKHDIVHQHGIWMYQSHIVNNWHQKTFQPTIISPRGMLDEWAFENAKWKKKIVYFLYEKNNLCNATVLHALNMSEAESFRKLGLKNPIAIIPNGIDLPESKKKIEIPTMKLRDKRKILLFLGRIHPKKGLNELLDAWRLIKSQSALNNWRLVIAGWDDGGHEATLQAKVKQDYLNDHISFEGAFFGKDKESLLKYSDAFVLPSHSEGLPMSVLEAWSYNLPVFMTEACNIPEGFVTGSAFKITTNPRLLANILVSTLDDSNVLSKAGFSGRQLIETSFTWDKVTNDILRLYMWLLGKSEKPEFITY